MIIWIKKNPLISCFFLFFIFYVVLIGNPDAPRQSTEGFYLKIAKEMWERGSFMTPYYAGERHWSKPPFMFWLPMPIYAAKLFDLLTASRLAILFFTLGLLALLSKWIEAHFKTSPVLGFAFLASSFGIMRYSRIFMMEMPLAILSTLGAAFVYSYIQDKSRHNFLLAVLFLSLSVLVKGPVSWVMIGFGLALYLAYRLYRKLDIPWRGLLSIGTLSVLFGSTWFVLCYLEYGREFFDFFFIKHNIGKFKAREYPISVLFQGLFIFSLPWVLIFISQFKKLKYLKEKSWWEKTLKNDAFVFVALNFLAFYLPWFFPSQRSHHYAFPATFFFLILILQVIKDIDLKKFSAKAPNTFFIGLTGLFTGVYLFVSFIFFSDQWGVMIIGLLTLLLWVGMLNELVLNPKSLFRIALTTGLCWSLIYCLAVVMVVRPLLPQKMIDYIGERSVSVVTMKPFFIAEQLNRSIDESLRHGPNLKNQLQRVDDLYLIYKSLYESQGLSSSDGRIVQSWSVWRRGVDFDDIIKALKTGRFEIFEDKVFLIERKD